MKRRILFFSVIIILSLLAGQNKNLSAQVTEQDSLALVALYGSTDGANWTNNTNWVSNEPVSTWYGITVSDNHVTGIDLQNNNLSGIIPEQIGDLLNLTTLELNNNQLIGNIPDVLGSLSELSELILYANELEGTIPETLGNLDSLTKLQISHNQLTGSIPASIGNMSKLESLSLNNNQLSGPIPDSFGGLNNLSLLGLNNNQLTGSIPASLSNLSNLGQLYLQNNSLEGNIPVWLGNLLNLYYLDLSYNQLTGEIPVELGNLTNLYQLRLGHNQLSGTLPDALGNLANLEFLNLSNNQFTGNIPESFGNLTNLKFLYLSGNQLDGAVPATILNCTNLLYLVIVSNDLDQLPDLSSLENLVYLAIDNNQFTFEDIEPNIGVPSDAFAYSPQDSVGEKQDTTIAQDSSLTLSVSVGGTANQYKWMKDGVDIPGADSSSYTISSAVAEDEGSYVCKITNTIAAELTLYSRAIDVTVGSVVGVTDNTAQIPKEFALYQNYPNPFNPSTTISFALPKDSNVKLIIYNCLGQVIQKIINSDMPAGKHNIVFNGNNLPSGIYLYQIITKDFIDTRKMLLIK